LITNLQGVYLYNFIHLDFILNIYNLVNKKSVLNIFTENLYLNILKANSNKYDIDSLRLIFPEFKEDLEMFEILSPINNSELYMTISIPNCKLYYPEPFIATPSFAHEDI